MSFFRFNQVANALKQTSQLESLIPQGLKGPIKAGPVLTSTQAAYTPLLSPEKPPRGSPQSNNPHNPHGWTSWQDIPDSIIPTTSTIDPDNDIYKERHYMNLRKKQIFYQIPDGTPIWLKNGTRDFIEYYGSFALVSLVLLYAFYKFCLIVRYGAKKS